MKSKLSLALVICMLIGILNGVTFIASAEGTGVEGDPIIITTVDELAAMTETTGKYYQLGNRLTLPSTWSGLVDFAGNFDGNNQVITLNGTADGVFRNITADATVKNVITTGSITDAVKTNLGALVGESAGNITNCTNYASITRTGFSDSNGIGGIVGKATSGEYTYLYNHGDITTKTGYTAGVIGFKSGNSATLAFAGNTGNITSLKTCIGGVVGGCYGPISYAYNTGKIDGLQAGGIVGAMFGEVALTNSFNIGEVYCNSTTEAGYGGLYGTSRHGTSSIVNGYNVGKVGNADGIDINKQLYGATVSDKTDSTSITNGYYLSDTKEADTYEETTALTSDEMKLETKFNFLFDEDNWSMAKGEYLYPILSQMEFYEESPEFAYEIRTVEDLKEINNYPDNKYILKNNLTLPSTWTGIVNFAGIFDGNNKVIYLDGTTDGVFRSITADATVKNVITNGSIADEAKTNLGALIGESAGTVTNCTNYASITRTGFSDSNGIGGIVGKATSGEYTYLYNHGDITTKTGYTAGVIGFKSGNSATLAFAGNTGNITSLKTCIGGVVGGCYGPISYAYNTGKIDGLQAGGIVGAMFGEVALTNSFNIGEVYCNSTTEAGYGGLYGTSRHGTSSIVNGYNAGKVGNEAGTDINKQLYGATVSDKTDSTSITNGYYLSDTKEADTYEETTALTADKLASDDIAEALGSDWCFKAGYMYPQLKELSALSFEEGHEFNKFVVKTQEDFEKLDEGKIAILANDLELTDYTPISFSGKLDGCNHSVTFNITSSNGSNVGLFSEISTTGFEIKNLTLNGNINVNYTENYNSNVGSLAGNIPSVTANRIKGNIENVLSNVNVTVTKADDVSGTSNVAGIIGNIGGYATVNMNNVVNNGAIKGINRTAGLIGMITYGYNTYGLMTNLANNGNVVSDNYAGGIICWSYAPISNSYNTGDITGTSFVAGITAINSDKGAYTNCYNTGDIISVEYTANIGGIMGQTKATTSTDIANCYNVGSIIIDGSAAPEKGIAGTYDTTTSAVAPTVTDSYYVSAASEGIYGTPVAPSEITVEKLGDGYVESEVEGYSFPQLNGFINEKAVTLYLVTINGENASDALKADKEYAKAGSTVTLTPKSDSGYDISAITINGEALTVNENGIYTFEINEDTTVNVTTAIKIVLPKAPESYGYENPINLFDIPGITHADRLSLFGKNVISAFAKIAGSNDSYTLVEYGFVVSSENAEPNIGNSEKINLTKNDGSLNIGVIVRGNVSVGTKYYISPYAIYKNAEGNEETLYGKVIESVAQAITY